MCRTGDWLPKRDLFFSDSAHVHKALSWPKSIPVLAICTCAVSHSFDGQKRGEFSTKCTCAHSPFLTATHPCFGQSAHVQLATILMVQRRNSQQSAHVHKAHFWPKTSPAFDDLHMCSWPWFLGCTVDHSRQIAHVQKRGLTAKKHLFYREVHMCTVLFSGRKAPLFWSICTCAVSHGIDGAKEKFPANCTCAVSHDFDGAKEKFSAKCTCAQSSFLTEKSTLFWGSAHVQLTMISGVRRGPFSANCACAEEGIDCKKAPLLSRSAHVQLSMILGSAKGKMPGNCTCAEEGDCLYKRHLFSRKVHMCTMRVSYCKSPSFLATCTYAVEGAKWVILDKLHMCRRGDWLQKKYLFYREVHMCTKLISDRKIHLFLRICTCAEEEDCLPTKHLLSRKVHMCTMLFPDENFTRFWWSAHVQLTMILGVHRRQLSVNCTCA